MSRIMSFKPVAGAFTLAVVTGLVAGPLVGEAGASPAKPPKKLTITLSATVPTTTGTKPLSNGGVTSQQSVVFTFSSNVANTTFTCSLDGKRASACTSPTSYTNLASGAHKLTLTGNAARAHKTTTTFSWTIDRTPPPAVTFSGVPTQPVKVPPTITFTGEAGDTFTCSIDGATPTACMPNNTGSQNVLVDGLHTLTVVPTDAAGNEGPFNSTSWTLDTTPPTVLINNPPPSPTNATSVHVNYTVSDLSAVVTCSLDSTPVTTGCGSTSFSASGLGNGAHTLVITATDLAGNHGSDSASWTVSPSALDVPVLTATPDGITNTATGQFAFSSPAGTTFDSFKCKLDGAASFTTCSSPHTTAALADGTHTFSVEGIAGANTSAAVVYTWIIDTVPPVLHVSGLPSGATRQTSIAPDITVSDAHPLPPTCSLAGPTTSSVCGAVNNLADGSYTLTVSDADRAGNTAPSVVAHWTVDTTAPVATITPPKVLNGPVLFTFNERVTGMTKGVAQLVLAANGKAVPAVLRCRSTKAVVPCTGFYRFITLTPVSPLVSGESYQARLLGGVIHDAAGNLTNGVTRSFRGVLGLSPSTVAAHYNWALVKNHRAIGHSYRTEHFAGATSRWAFTGKKLVWWTRTGPAQGRASVLVDGHRIARVNNYAPHNHARVARTFRHLGAGKHVVTIRVLGKRGSTAGRGTSVAVDAFTARGVRTRNPVLVSTWGKLGKAVHADLRGAGVVLRFRGTSFSWRTVIGPAMGIAQLRLDGKVVSTVDNYAKKAKVVTRQLAGLTNAFHKVQIIVAGRHQTHSTGNEIVIARYIVG